MINDNSLIIEVDICFKNVINMSSNPHLLLRRRFSINLVTVCSLTSFNVNVLFCLFKSM